MGTGFAPTASQAAMCILVLHRADLQASGIGRDPDRPPGIRQVAETVFPEGQGLELGLFQVVQKLLAYGTVQHLVHVSVIIEQERDIQNPDGGIESADRSRRADIDIDGSLLHGFEQLPFALAELTVRVYGHLDAPVASLLDKLCKFGCRLVVGMARGSQGGELQLGLEFPFFGLV